MGLTSWARIANHKMRIFLDEQLRKVFFNYAFIAHRFRCAFIIIPIIITLGLSSGIPLYLRASTILDQDRIFSPSNGAYVQERREFTERWPYDESNFLAGKHWDYDIWYEVMYTVRDYRRSLFDFLPQIRAFEKHISTNITVEFVNRWDYLMNGTYGDFCAGVDGTCALNNEEQINWVADDMSVYTTDFVTQEEKDLVAEHLRGQFKVRWPISLKSRNEYRIAHLIGGVDAITKVDFVDVYRPAFSLSALNLLEGKLRYKQLITPAIEQEFETLRTSKDEVLAKETISLLMEQLSDELGKFEQFKAMRTLYFIKKDPKYREIGERWIQKVNEFVESVNVSNITVTHYRRSQIGKGMTKITEYNSYHKVMNQSEIVKLRKLRPLFALLFALVVAFASFCSLSLLRRVSDGRYAVDWARSKPLVAVLGVVTAGMGAVSGLGLLLLAGVPFVSFVIIMPFLVVAIGVDDMFVMCGSWHRTKVGDPTSVRLAHTLSHSAVAITITSATDAISFAIGCITDMPGIWIFCSYISVAIIFNYIYQLTFFVGIMSLFGDWESQGRHSVMLCYKVRTDSRKDSCVRRWLLGGTAGGRSDPETELVRVEEAKNARRCSIRKSTLDVAPRSQPLFVMTRSFEEGSVEAAQGIIARFFRLWYGPILMHPVVKLIVAAFYALYIFLSIYGTTVMKEGLEPSRIMYDDDTTRSFYGALSQNFMREGMSIDVLFTKVPDLFPEENRRKINETIDDVLYTEHTMGSDSVSCWMWRYETHWDKKLNLEQRIASGQELAQFYTRLRDEWLLIDDQNWRADVVFEGEEYNATLCQFPPNATFADVCPYYRVNSFRCAIGLRNLQDAEGQAATMRLFRGWAERHPEFGLFSFHFFFILAEGFLQTTALTLRNMAIAVAVITVVTLLLIPSATAVALIVVSIVSIDVGVVGFLGQWDVALDSVSSINLLMVVGFAVDLTAHIAHAFVAAEGQPDERAIKALENFGSPILQGGVSTLVGVMALCAIPQYYIASVFLKSVVLCICFGLLHSLVFLPVALSSLLAASHRLTSFLLSRRKVRPEATSQPEFEEIHLEKSAPTLTGPPSA